MERNKFLNPFMDISFKKLFGEEDSKKILIEFLNDIFDGIKIIESIDFINTEVLPELEDGKKNLLDILCKDSDGNRYIVEMQVRPEMSFTERMLYYLARIMSKNSLKASQNYSQIKGVYAVVLMDFTIQRFLTQKKLVFTMRDESNPSIQLSSQFTEIFIQLPLFENNDFSKCCTYLDKWIYLLLNMEKMKFIPDFLVEEKAAFRELLEKAQEKNLSEEERDAYDLQVMQYRSYLSSFDYAAETGYNDGLAYGREQGMIEGMEKGIVEGMEKGIAEGMEKGIAEGMEKGRYKFIKNMQKAGVSNEEISKYLEISKDEIR